MTSGLARFGRPQTLVCNLGTSGALPLHQPGSAYNGTFSVTNRVGTVTAELVSATPALPAGWSLQVNQATGVVTLAWPASSAGGALPNLGFESGAADWLLGNAWAIDSTPLVESGTQSAKYRGVGQSSMTHAQAVPVTPGQTITASARISKGNTRSDLAGGAVVLEWLSAAGIQIGFNVGNVVNTGTAAFQNSTVTATAPAGAGLVRLAVSGTRDARGRASDAVYADNVSWNHTYALGGSGATDYAVVIRVRDGRGCQATLTQTIGQGIPLNTVSLLRFNGANGSTTFTDETGKTWTRTGTPTITTAISQFDGASGAFSTNDRIDCASADFNFGTGDFTMEGWFRAGGQVAYFSFGTRLVYASAGTAPIYFDGVTNAIVGTAPASGGDFQHIALVRKAGVVSLYQNGQRVGAPFSEPSAINPGAMRYGFYNAGNGAAPNYDECRVVAGQAVYDGPSYTVPPARFPFP